MAGPTYGKNPPANQLDFGIVTGQHWRSWDELVEQWQWADESGLDSAWAFDHFFSLRDGELGPCLEGWTLLAALAVKTSNVQIGLMVNGNTHRNPAILAKQAVTVDIISGGRSILGVGAAWHEREHQAYGIDFPSPRERVDRFGEAMELHRRLETQERATFEGQYYRLDNAPFEPRPVFGHIPILVGSTGKRMLHHVARYADQWDGGGTPDELRATGERLKAACAEIDRDPSEIRWAYSTGSDKFDSVDTFRKHVNDFAAVGVRSFLFTLPGGSPNATIRTIANEVIPELREEWK
ncbi:MAG TPA: LLM class flavin-dependent oxidoreductase [Thermomicrobiales bacterium]|nr:LLM class flavin-dependent oxidoreductase [Thermomicrobiales bacterium]